MSDEDERMDMEENERFADALANDRVHWCRARLLHALAGAGKQGVLGEVIDEIFDDGLIKDTVMLSLAENGWIKKDLSREKFSVVTDHIGKMETRGLEHQIFDEGQDPRQRSPADMLFQTGDQIDSGPRVTVHATAVLAEGRITNLRLNGKPHGPPVDMPFHAGDQLSVIIPGTKTCIVNGCTNRDDEGDFVGDLCFPCHDFVARGRGVHSQAFRNALVAAAEVGRRVANLEHVRGGLSDDRVEEFPAWAEGKQK